MSFMPLLEVLGGLGLFIFGMYMLTDSLKKLSLGFLKKILEKITSNRIKALLTGTFVTALIQSSSTTSVILIGFLNVGVLTLVKALPVIIGANIGTTITAQIIAFKLTKFSPVFIILGAFIFFVFKKQKHKNKGLAVFGFGLLFLGLSIMTGAVKPLAGDPAVTGLFVTFSESPLLGILAGLVITVILQSSSSTIGIVIALATAGLIGFPAALYIILGDNIGTCVTAVIASFRGKIASKRLALGHTLFNVIGTAIAIPMIPLYLHYIPMLSADLSRQIANSHTIFNIINALIFLPFIPLYAKLLKKLVPGQDYEKKEIKFLDKNLLGTPILAVMAVSKQMSVMISICRGMLMKSRKCMIKFDHKLKEEIDTDEQSVDEMQTNITYYLIDISKSQLSGKLSRLLPALIHSVNDLERVGDYCENIVKLSERMYEENLVFSKYAKSEIVALYQMTLRNVTYTKKAIETDSHESALRTLEINMELKERIEKYRHNNLKRLETEKCHNNSGLVYSDFLIVISRINEHLCNITQGILNVGKRQR